MSAITLRPRGATAFHLMTNLTVVVFAEVEVFDTAVDHLCGHRRGPSFRRRWQPPPHTTNALRRRRRPACLGNPFAAPSAKLVYRAPPNTSLRPASQPQANDLPARLVVVGPLLQPCWMNLPDTGRPNVLPCWVPTVPSMHGFARRRRERTSCHLRANYTEIRALLVFYTLPGATMANNRRGRPRASYRSAQ